MISRKSICKHKVSIMEELCRAGVNVREHVGGDSVGWGIRRPCDGENVGPFVNPCELYKEVTQDEIDEEARFIQRSEEHFKLVVPIIAAIKANNEGENTKGTVVCPICKGKLHWIHHAINGRVYGRCDTEDCVHWME